MGRRESTDGKMWTLEKFCRPIIYKVQIFSKKFGKYGLNNALFLSFMIGFLNGKC